jgi:peptide deformylase|tara:strand:+ start:106 stop:570 length:465 start_codon:yes stop_codon:yes gene_type:complete
MTKLKKIGDDVLRLVAEEITDIDDSISDLYNEMVENMHKYGGIGLAAPQIGVSKRIIIYEDEGIIREMINPRITWKSVNNCKFDEGCLSVPDEHGEVIRPIEIKVKFQLLSGKYKHWKLNALPARVVQHEIDHLNGILFVDYLKDHERKLKVSP